MLGSELDTLYIVVFKTVLKYTTNLLGFMLDIQDVPLATEPGISLIILPLMTILQRNLKRIYLIV